MCIHDEYKYHSCEYVCISGAHHLETPYLSLIRLYNNSAVGHDRAQQSKKVSNEIRDWSLIPEKGGGGGGATKQEQGASQVLPLENKGSEKDLAMLKGMWGKGVRITVLREAYQVLAMLKGRGGGGRKRFAPLKGEPEKLYFPSLLTCG